MSNAVGSHIDFSLPTIPSRPLVPVRPGVQRPPKPGPKRQSEVNEDFSNVKAPNQVAFTTYWSGVEPYLREIREDDLAMLGFKVCKTSSMSCQTDSSRSTRQKLTRYRREAGITPRYGTRKMACPVDRLPVTLFPAFAIRLLRALEPFCPTTLPLLR